MPALVRHAALAMILAIALGALTLWPGRPPAAAQEADCAGFDSQIWAQTVYASDPAHSTALDPDGNGIACEELPPGAAPVLWAEAIPADAAPATFTAVTDGDTVHARVDGRDEAVRLLLIDAPEEQGPYTRAECYGEEAAAYLGALLASGDLYLQRDVSDRDRYGRLLRYAWLERDGQIYLANEALVRSGYAPQVTYPPDVKYERELQEAEEFARANGYGLWSACPSPGGSDTPDQPVTQPAANAPPAAGEPARDDSGVCDPAYPTVCIPPLSVQGDLDCQDIPYQDFPVLPPDPHHFDGGGDGIGCEGP